MSAPKLTARAQRWLTDMYSTLGERGVRQFWDCPRGLVTELEDAGLVEVFRGPGHELGRWAGVRLTEDGVSESSRLSVARRRAREAAEAPEQRGVPSER